jgi:hypothetical protein
MPKHVLKAEQINLLRDFPREFAALEYAGYSDGILLGCRLAASDTICAAPGVILRRGVFYRMMKPFMLPYEPADALRYVNVRFTEDALSEDIVSRSAEIVLEDAPAGEDGMELARFKLKNGSRLRSDYTDFEDLDTEFDTLRLTHAPCAGKGGNTLHPFITEYFAKEALACRPENPLDIQFAFFCIQNSRVNLGVLRHYTGEESGDTHRLYLALRKKLADIRAGRSERPKAERQYRKISVD